MREPQIQSIVDSLVGAWNDRDLDRFMGHLDEAVVWDDPAMLSGPAEGRSAVRAFSESVLRAFPDFTYRIRGPICVAQSGTRCAIPWEIRATHTGRFDPFGFAPTGQAITLHGVDLIEIEGMKVTRMETTFSLLPALEQALRLRPLSKSYLTMRLVVWLQRLRAYWLRPMTRGGK